MWVRTQILRNDGLDNMGASLVSMLRLVDDGVNKVNACLPVSVITLLRLL